MDVFTGEYNEYHTDSPIDLITRRRRYNWREAQSYYNDKLALASGTNKQATPKVKQHCTALWVHGTRA